MLTTFGGCGDFSGYYEEIESSSSTSSSINYLTTGGSGSIFSSPDGINWTDRTSESSNSLNDVIYENSEFLTVGDSGTIIESSDGSTWTTRASGTTNGLN